MPFAFEAPRDRVNQKPPHGAPCNGCGLCCMSSRCPLAMDVLGLEEEGRCPALSFGEDGKSQCGIVARPADFAPEVVRMWGTEVARTAAFFLIGSGLGCDALIDFEEPDPKFYERIEDLARRKKRWWRASLKIWGVI